MDSLLPKSRINVAGMRAVLPMRVAVSGKWTTASDARKMIDGFSVDLLEMVVPPFLAAGPAAEASAFSSRRLINGFPAVRTEDDRSLILFRSSLAGQAVSLAERFHCVFRQGKGGTDLAVADAFFPHTSDLRFLFICHR